MVTFSLVWSQRGSSERHESHARGQLRGSRFCCGRDLLGVTELRCIVPQPRLAGIADASTALRAQHQADHDRAGDTKHPE
jgi:hypothetical protein